MHQQHPATVTTETGNAVYLKPNCFAEVTTPDGNTEIPFCLPGEKIEFTKVQYPKRTHNYFKDVLKPSLERQEALCKHFTACGGCMLQHTKEGFYKEFKTALLTQAFLEHKLNHYLIQPIKIVPIAQRRRANLEAIKRGDKLFMGFHRLQSHQIIDMEECPVLTKPLQESLPYLRTMLDDLLEPWQKSSIFLLELNGLVDIGLEIQGMNQLTEPQREMLKAIASKANWGRLQFRHRKFYDLLLQTQVITTKFGKLTVPMDPWAFLQAVKIAENWMQEIIQQTLENSPPQSRLLDLFSGRGTFTGVLLNYGPVDAYEGNAKAIEILGTSGKDHPLCAQVRDLFENPLPTKSLNCYSTAVIDPPRAGAEAQIQQLSKSSVPTIIYISCNPQTFARDAKTLEDGGYTLQTVHPIDQFLWTPHLEVVGIFKKSANC